MADKRTAVVPTVPPAANDLVVSDPERTAGPPPPKAESGPKVLDPERKAAGGPELKVAGDAVVVLCRKTVHNMRYGGTVYDFDQGKLYKVPAEVAVALYNSGHA